MLRIDLQLPTQGLGRNVALRRSLTGFRELFADPAVLGVFALVILVGGAAAFLQRQAATEMQTARIALQQAVNDSSRLEEDIRRADELANKRQQIDDRLDEIRTIDQNRFAFVHLMDHAAAALPFEQAWIRELETSNRDPLTGALTFRLAGSAASEEVIFRFRSDLESSPFIGPLEQGPLVRTKINDQDVLEFEFSGQTELPDISFLQTETISADGTSRSGIHPVMVGPAASETSFSLPQDAAGTGDPAAAAGASPILGPAAPRPSSMPPQAVPPQPGAESEP